MSKRHRIAQAWMSVALWAGLAFLAGCKTTPAPPKTPPANHPVEFQPAHYTAALEHERGRYRDLYSPDSYALWVAPEVAAEKLDAARQGGEDVPEGLQRQAGLITRNYVIIELHLESAFSDASIGYDAVGLRGVTCYLEAPDGREVRPLQRVIGRVEQGQAGALKVFRRVNLLVFPRRDLWVGSLTLDPNYASMKLVLDAFDTEHAFEWPDARFAAQESVPAPQDRLKRIQAGFVEVFGALQRLSHEFD